MNVGNEVYAGLSSDTKPTTGIPAGAIFTETDTGQMSIWNGTVWIQADTTSTSQTLTNKTIDHELNTILNAQQGSQFTVYKSGSNYKYRNWATGATTSNTVADTLINGLLTAQSSAGAYITFLPAAYPLNNPLTIPVSTGVPFMLQGPRMPLNRAGQQTVVFQTTSSFPTGRYMMEGISTPSGGQRPYCDISNFFFYNPNFKSLGTIDAGGVKLESDSGVGGSNWIQKITNCQFQYCWRGIHIVGTPYYGQISNCVFSDVNSSFVGDADVKFECGGHSDRPKLWHIDNISVFHSGILNNSLYLEGGYNYISDYRVDGLEYNEAPFAIHGDGSSPGSYSNHLVRLYAIDLNTPSGTNVGAIYLTGAQCYDNEIVLAEVGGYPKMVNFANGAFRNTVSLRYFGAAVSVEDTGAGINNVVDVHSGTATAVTVDSKITSTQSLATIRDLRTGLDNILRPSAGRIFGFRMGFNGQVANSTGYGYGLLTTVILANGTGVANATGTDTTDGSRVNWTTGTNNTFGRAGWWSGNVCVARKYNPTFTVRFRSAQTISANSILYIGLVNQATQPTAGTSLLNTYLNSKIGVLFGWRSTDTTPMIISNNNQTTAVYTSVPGIWNAGATDTNTHTLSISLNDAIPNINWSFDGVLQTPITDTTNSVPPSTTVLAPMFMMEAQTATNQQIFEHWSELSQDAV